jgi:hypothetical protein
VKSNKQILTGHDEGWEKVFPRYQTVVSSFRGYSCISLPKTDSIMSGGAERTVSGAMSSAHVNIGAFLFDPANEA